SLRAACDTPPVLCYTRTLLHTRIAPGWMRHSRRVAWDNRTVLHGTIAPCCMGQLPRDACDKPRVAWDNCLVMHATDLVLHALLTRLALRASSTSCRSRIGGAGSGPPRSA